MGQYRKKPVVIEAYCFDQQPGNYRPDWFQDRVTSNVIVTFPDHAIIHTLEGDMIADLGDWIVKGVEGEVYPVKLNIFAATYEAAEPIAFGSPEYADYINRHGHEPQ
jgi:hypothetical protein